MSARHFMILGLLTAATLAPLGNAYAMTDTRIGYVNTVELMNKSPQGKAALQEMKTEFAPREKKLAAKQKDVKRLEDRLRRDSTVMSKAEITKLEQELRTRRLDLRRAQVHFRNDLTARRNKVFAKLRRRLYDAVRDVAKKDDYSLIVGQGVVYVRSQVNITRQVLALLERERGADTRRSASNK